MTLGGQGSGAECICVLLTLQQPGVSTYISTGLFQRVILESSTRCMAPFPDSQAVGTSVFIQPIAKEVGRRYSHLFVSVHVERL